MIRTKQDYKYYLAQDASNGGFKNSLVNYLFNDTWKFLRLLRLSEYLMNTKTGLHWNLATIYIKLRLRAKGSKLGFSIPPNVFGPGLMLPHFGTIVVNKKARIGANCKIHVCTNIGASFDSPDSVPLIGDNCYIGPGAKIFGCVTIANNVSIGANAVVNKSCKNENVNLIGVPAKEYPKNAVKCK
jgi:serine O-acetyltransferase